MATTPSFYVWQTRAETYGGVQHGSDEWQTPGVSFARGSARPAVAHGSGKGDKLVCLSPELAWYAGVQYWYGFGSSVVERELRVVRWAPHEGAREVMAQKWLAGAEGDLSYPG